MEGRKCGTINMGREGGRENRPSDEESGGQAVEFEVGDDG